MIVAFVATLSSKSQERIDSKPATLSYKSKEIKSAQYWNKSSKTGQWESRKNSKLVYLGEGVAVDNFNTMFIGEYHARRYLFLDFFEYRWRYPNLKMEWTIYEAIMAALLSDEDYTRLSNLSAGESLMIAPRFYHKMLKGNREYSFPFFLSLGETELSSSETLYNSYKRTDGEDYAERQWKENYPLIHFAVFKRVVDADGTDVVRFVLYPHALSELIDDSYFEVDYEVFRNLFTEDRKQIYK